LKRSAEAFMTSLKAQLSPDAMNYGKFMTEKTYIRGQKFSFEGHDFQRYCTDLLQNNPGCELDIIKPSQIGMSEWIYRVVLARMAVIPDTPVALSMPSITFSNEVFKTRLASVIRQSPVLADLLDSNNDSASVKAFVNGSIIYGLAGSGQSQSSLLNRPIQWIVVDEVDRQEKDTYTGFISRRAHQDLKDCCTVLISTPTIADFGIDAEVKSCGIIHEPLIKCECGHILLPDYFKHVVIPGYDESLALLTQEAASMCDIDKAYLACPECGGDLYSPGCTTHWEVTKYRKHSQDKIGVKLNPWVALRSIPRLIRESLGYSSHVEFLNQGLGLTANMTDSAIDRSVFIFDNQPKPPGINVFGLDVGKLSHYTHSIIKQDTTIRVVDRQIIKLHNLEDFLADRFKNVAFTSAVMDQNPYNELAYRLVRQYPRLYSCIYISPTIPIPEMYRLRLNDKHNQLVRQVALNKTLGMDTFVSQLKDFVTFQSSDMDAIFVKHCMAMRRVRDYTKSDDMHYRWISTSREDHYFHSFVYMMLAAKLAYAGVDVASHIPVFMKSISPEKLRAQRKRR